MNTIKLLITLTSALALPAMAHTRNTVVVQAPEVCSTPVRVNGPVAGAVLGGIAGAIIGHNDDGHAPEGALIGALVGLGLGSILDRDCDIRPQRPRHYQAAPTIIVPRPPCPPKVVIVKPRPVHHHQVVVCRPHCNLRHDHHRAHAVKGWYDRDLRHDDHRRDAGRDRHEERRNSREHRDSRR